MLLLLSYDFFSRELVSDRGLFYILVLDQEMTKFNNPIFDQGQTFLSGSGCLTLWDTFSCLTLNFVFKLVRLNRDFKIAHVFAA